MKIFVIKGKKFLGLVITRKNKHNICLGFGDKNSAYKCLIDRGLI